MKINGLPELLAPAGDFECLVAAVRGGANAVYIGGKAFSARAYAKNFDIDEIKRAVAYCHLHGVKLYVTMNIQVYDNEIDEAVEFASQLYRVGVDALIIADFGLISRIRRALPDFELHASTQMSVHNSVGADLAYDLGCSRVVLARELSGENVRDVTASCKAEVEFFLHGALCVCHSGQCLFSSMIGGRSGNRGECAQPCRLPYNDGKYILSLNDLSLANHIKELVDCGVASLKIEGRMKSPDYVYTVTSIYRRLLDECRNSTKDEDAALARAFSRSGFTDGYFTGRTFGKMTGIRTEEDKRVSKTEEKGDFTPDRIATRAKVEILLGKESVMTLSFKDLRLGDRTVTVKGAVAEAARNAPLTEDGVKERLAKMGNTFLSLSVEDIDLTLDDGVNISPSLLNALRRSAAESFECFDRECEAISSVGSSVMESISSDIKRTAIFFDIETLKRVRTESLAYFDVIFAPLVAFDSVSDKANGVYIPPVVMEDELANVRAMLKDARSLGAEYALIGNLSHFALAREAELIPIGDFRLNVCNAETMRFVNILGAECVVASVELTPRQFKDVGGAAVVYGRIPLMITEKCFMKDNFGCDKCGKATLSDRKGMKFPMMREFEHRNIIFNAVSTYMGDKMNELSRDASYHFIFSTESSRDVEQVIDAFKRRAPYPLDGSFRRMGKRKVDEK